MADFKFCSPHWRELRDEVAKHGLSKYVAKSGEEVAAKMKEDPACLHSRETFDPLMAAHNLIVMKAASTVGKFFGCPVDYAGPTSISDAMAIVIDHARGLGFIS